jgi:hypothetical protein
VPTLPARFAALGVRIRLLDGAAEPAGASPFAAADACAFG